MDKGKDNVEVVQGNIEGDCESSFNNHSEEVVDIFETFCKKLDEMEQLLIEFRTENSVTNLILAKLDQIERKVDISIKLKLDFIKGITDRDILVKMLESVDPTPMTDDFLYKATTKEVLDVAKVLRLLPIFGASGPVLMMKIKARRDKLMEIKETGEKYDITNLRARRALEITKITGLPLDEATQIV